ncbi:MAG: PilZ domain-containing protein [Vulcanimicrobiota bacterium]
MIERRQNHRVPKTDTAVILHRDKTYAMAQLLDVSATGARLQIAQELPIGSRIKLTIQVSARELHTVEGLAVRANDGQLGMAFDRPLVGRALASALAA